MPPIRITLQAKLAAGLHILGPGRTVALVDRAIEVDAQGFPLIPASSIRGRVRAHLERLLRAWGQPVCTPPAPERMCPHAWNQDEGPPAGYCQACRIFGSPWYPAAIINTDLRLVDSQRTAGPDFLRTERMSLGISRRLGTAQGERLFSTEATVRDLDARPLCFEGLISGRLTPIEAGWLLAALQLVTHAGGNKARGLGELCVSATEVTWWQDGQWVATDGRPMIEEVLSDA
ncbi:MAG TPA: hypothetical protein DEP84_03855 [Chloroflexi bacterium]|nr:hypothetical protein [Chloroflexota bacterium]